MTARTDPAGFSEAQDGARIGTLFVESGLLAGRRRLLEGCELTLGRSGTCDIWIPGAHVSRVHLRLSRREDGCWWVIDPGTENGTTVNGVRVKEQPLRHDDEIVLATQIRMTFRLEPVEKAAVLWLCKQDVAAYAAAAGGEVELAGFLGWLKRCRPHIRDVDAAELERIARERMLEFAHCPDLNDVLESSEQETRRLDPEVCAHGSFSLCV